MNIYPYVYRIDHPSGEFYIGYRAANKVPAIEDLGSNYKTSSKYLSYPFEEYSITVIAEFFTDTAKTDAYDFEQATIFEHWGNLLLANKSCYHGSKARFRNPGGKPLTQEHRQKIIDNHVGMRGRKQLPETVKKIAALSIGRTHTEETRKKMAASHLGVLKTPHSDETKSKMAIAQQLRREREKQLR